MHFRMISGNHTLMVKRSIIQIPSKSISRQWETFLHGCPGGRSITCVSLLFRASSTDAPYPLSMRRPTSSEVIHHVGTICYDFVVRYFPYKTSFSLGKRILFHLGSWSPETAYFKTSLASRIGSALVIHTRLPVSTGL